MNERSLRNAAGHAPLRRPESVRRTMSIDVTWPEGYGGRMSVDARCRDIATKMADRAATLMNEAAYRATLGFGRDIESIESVPTRLDLIRLVGINAARVRHYLGDVVPEDRATGGPLFQLLDDLVGASLVAPWAWSRWTPEWRRGYFPADEDQAKAMRKARMEGVCTGFRPTSSAFDDVWGRDQSCCPVGELVHPDDPAGWHAFPSRSSIEASFRRVRRLDAWLEAGFLYVHSHFQDSAVTPDGGRVAVHEYTLSARVDTSTLALHSISATPCILPNPECPEAIDNIGRLASTPLSRLRTTTLAELRGVLGCTHLNDAIRALADMPKVAKELLASCHG